MPPEPLHPMPVEEADLEAAGGQQGNPQSSPEHKQLCQQQPIHKLSSPEQQLCQQPPIQQQPILFPLSSRGAASPAPDCARALAARAWAKPRPAPWPWWPIKTSCSSTPCWPRSAVRRSRRSTSSIPALLLPGHLHFQGCRRGNRPAGRTPCASRPGPTFPGHPEDRTPRPGLGGRGRREPRAGHARAWLPRRATVGDAIRLRVDLIQRLEEASLTLDPAV